jgi:serine/threonine protein kinase
VCCAVLQGILLQVLLGVAQGMQWLHEQGILHGDLKAANVMLHGGWILMYVLWLQLLHV